MADPTHPTQDEERPPAAVPVNPLNDPTDGGDAESSLNPARTGLGDAPSDEAGASSGPPARTTTSRTGGAGAVIEEPPTPS